MVDYDGNEPISLTFLFVSVACVAIAGLTSYLGSLVKSGEFQRSWNQLYWSISNSIKSGLAALGGSIRRMAATFTAKAKVIAQDIADSFAKAQTIPKYKTPREVHHIVAQRAPNASYAREVLKSVGIDYNSALNLVSLKTGLHRRLHTDVYYGWANSVVISAYNSANGNKAKQYANVVVALGVIRGFLLSMDAISPY